MRNMSKNKASSNRLDLIIDERGKKRERKRREEEERIV